MAGTYPVFGGNGVRGYTEAFTHQGDFCLVGRQGARCGNVNYASGRFWASEHAVVASPRATLDVQWLGEMLRTMNLGQYSVSAAQPGLSVEVLSSLSTILPPLIEQCAIGVFLREQLGRVDRLVEEQQRLIELLKEKRHAVVSHAVTKGLNPDAPMKPSGIEWLGDVPAHWTISKMKWVAKLESGHTPDRKRPEYWDGDIPWISLNDTAYLRDHDLISDTAFSITALGIENSSAHLLPAGTVVFSRDATIGRCAITTRPMAVSQHFIGWVCGEAIRPAFLLMRLRSMVQELERLSTGATIRTIGMPEVRTLITPVPPVHEQDVVVAAVHRELESLDALASDAHAAVNLLDERRMALISAAVTGQIDVREHSHTTATNA